jgi:hypothetical protein
MEIRWNDTEEGKSRYLKEKKKLVQLPLSPPRMPHGLNLNLNPNLGCVEACIACHGTARRSSETLIYYRETTAVFLRNTRSISVSCAKNAGLLRVKPCRISHTLVAAVHTGFMGLRYINFQKNTCPQRLMSFQNKTQICFGANPAYYSMGTSPEVKPPLREALADHSHLVTRLRISVNKPPLPLHICMVCTGTATFLNSCK